MDYLLEIIDIRCAYNGQTVIDQLSLRIRRGVQICLLGPSGCGKTTVLRAIAGFEPLTQGEIRLDGTVMSQPGYMRSPERRGLGMVFQDYALFPHLTVGANIGFGLRDKSRRERHRAAGRLLELVGLAGYEKRYPHELSGGQQQRVAVARALAPEPALLLLDEPFSNLDVDLRERLATDVRDILIAQDTAAIFVTHDQHEAFVMGKRIGVMNHGRILQWDTPFNLYHAPVNRFVADFIGQGRFIRGRMVSPNTVDTELGRIEGNLAYNLPARSPVDVLLRPDDILIGPEEELECLITDRAFKGAETLYTLRLPSGQEVFSLVPSRNDYTIGQKIGVRAEIDHLILFQHS